jgi:hypothetical protein
VPTTQKEVLNFVQLCNFYARFIHHFSNLTAPLRKALPQEVTLTPAYLEAFEILKLRLISTLLRKALPQEVTLTPAYLEAFEILKLRLISAPCQILPEVNSDATFTVTTNAWPVGIATFLLKETKDDGFNLSLTGRVIR